MSMTWEEFDNHVRAVFSTSSTWQGKEQIHWFYGSPLYYQVEWVTGGLTGGNCWGDNADQSVSSDPEPELELLDQFLEVICPALTLRQYRELTAAVVNRGSYTDYEYYGNYTTKCTKTVSYRDLYNEMVKRGLI
jgi:hypothetical protein